MRASETGERIPVKLFRYNPILHPLAKAQVAFVTGQWIFFAEWS
jgi:hypothetical protein